MDKISYALGMSIGQSLIGSGVSKIEFDDFLSGVKTIFTNRTPAVSAEEGNEILNEFFEKVKKEKEESDKKEREENMKLAEEYMKENLKVDGMKVTESGLHYKVIRRNNDPSESPTAHSRVKCHYEGRLINGTVFDSSYKRGEPATFGLDQVIQGWTEGLQLMGVGDKYEFIIPPELGYGEVGVPGHIPGNSVLIFVVELLGIEK